MEITLKRLGYVKDCDYHAFVRYFRGPLDHEDVIDIDFKPREVVQTFYNDGHGTRSLTHDEIIACANEITKRRDRKLWQQSKRRK